jgi:hypothetical protein
MILFINQSLGRTEGRTTSQWRVEIQLEGGDEFVIVLLEHTNHMSHGFRCCVMPDRSQISAHYRAADIEQTREWWG